MRTQKILTIIFFLAAAASLAAMLYHVRGFMNPTQLTPAWRHAVFVAINTILLYAFLKRPNWFIWFFALLTIQQLYSHGSYAISLWREHQEIHWISVIVVLAMPLLLLLLLWERKLKKQAPAS